MEYHEYANLFPMMNEKEFEDLCSSISRGYHAQNPIIIYQGKILDGRNRQRACERVNVLAMYSEFVGTDDEAFEYAKDNNLTRKHWTADQLAMIALELEPIEAERARQRMSAGGGDKTSGSADQHYPVEDKGKAAEKAAKKTGASVRKVQRAKALKKKSAKLAEEVKAGNKSLVDAEKEVKKEERKEYIEKQVEEIQSNKFQPPTGLFDVIVVDPPWPYDTKYDPNGRRAANPYPEMSLDEIQSINLPASNDCILWLWTTHKFMRHSFDLLDQWGFRDVAIVTWVKDRMGLGSWLRSQSEFCIMAVKGSPKVNLTNQTTIINGALREHSRKPDEFYSFVDSLCVGYKLDWFSRQQRDGWVSFGNDTEKFNE